jgi:hypothetical protein
LALHGNRLEADFDENVSAWPPIDKVVTPSYLSTNPADRAASRRHRMKDVRKVRHFPRSTTMSDRAGMVATEIASAMAFLPIGFGKVRHNSAIGREGLTA